MISWRGLFAVGVGVLFLAFGSVPDVFEKEAPPAFVRVIILFAGAALAGFGLLSIVFVAKRQRLLATIAAEPAQIVLTVEDGSDSTSYLLDIRLDGSRWQIGATGKAAQAVAPNTLHDGQVWCDPKSGAPVAVAIKGLQINTLPLPRRMPEGGQVHGG